MEDFLEKLMEMSFEMISGVEKMPSVRATT